MTDSWDRRSSTLGGQTPLRMLSFRYGFVECGRGYCHLGREGEVHEGMNFDSRIDGGAEHVAGGVLGVGGV